MVTVSASIVTSGTRADDRSRMMSKKPRSPMNGRSSRRCVSRNRSRIGIGWSASASSAYCCVRDRPLTVDGNSWKKRTSASRRNGSASSAPGAATRLTRAAGSGSRNAFHAVDATSYCAAVTGFLVGNSDFSCSAFS